MGVKRWEQRELSADTASASAVPSDAILSMRAKSSAFALINGLHLIAQETLNSVTAQHPIALHFCSGPLCTSQINTIGGAPGSTIDTKTWDWTSKDQGNED